MIEVMIVFVRPDVRPIKDALFITSLATTDTSIQRYIHTQTPDTRILDTYTH